MFNDYTQFIFKKLFYNVCVQLKSDKTLCVDAT